MPKASRQSCIQSRIVKSRSLLFMAAIGVAIISGLVWLLSGWGTRPDTIAITRNCKTARADIAASERVSKKTYTDPSGTFQVTYPSNWLVQVTTASGNTLSDAPTDPAQLPGGQPSERTSLEIYDRSYPPQCSNDSNDAPTVYLDTYIAGSDALSEILASYDTADAGGGDAGGFHPTASTVNGDPSVQAEVTSKNKAADGTPVLKSNQVAISHQNVVLVFSENEVWQLGYSSPFDFSAYDPIFNEVVQSTKFLK